MQFSEPLLDGRLLRRYQRFLADVVLDDGSQHTVHCPNSGAMTGCLGDGWPVVVSDSCNPARKLRYTLEMVHNGRCWIGVNTQRANRVVEEAIGAGAVAELAGFRTMRREVPYGAGCRVDLLLENQAASCFVEVKNVTLLDAAGRYCFPDAVTSRGRKHLVELATVVRSGARALLFFLIQRGDGWGCTLAPDIDPRYVAEMERALAAGVEVVAYRAEVSPRAIEVAERVPFTMP